MLDHLLGGGDDCRSSLGDIGSCEVLDRSCILNVLKCRLESRQLGIYFGSGLLGRLDLRVSTARQQAVMIYEPANMLTALAWN
jgi:hypothetical protein